MRLRIAFIGYDEEQTRAYFRQMVNMNSDQIRTYDLQQGRIVLRDGTEILRVSPNVRFVNGRFDQVIIADNHRRNCEIRNRVVLTTIASGMSFSPVPPEFQWQHYDIDA